MPTGERKKIIFIINSLECGGAERFLVDLVNHLDRERFDPIILAVIRRGDLAFELKNVPLIVVGKKTKLGLMTIWKLYRILVREKPNIVHTMLFGGDLWGRIAAVLARVPRIISTEQNLHTVDRPIEYFSKRLLNRFTHTLVFISNSVRTYYAHKVPLKNIRTAMIPNGIVTQHFMFQRDAFPKGHSVRIVCVARFVEQKGHAYLIDALKKIQHLPWQSELVGEGPLRMLLQEKVKALHMSDRIRFLGQQTNIAEILKSADIHVLPSIFEGQGVVLLEASAAGCFLIASKVDGISEMFEDGKTAHLVPPKDPDALARSLSWFFDHRGEALALAKNAQQQVLEQYDITKSVKAYEEVYVIL